MRNLNEIKADLKTAKANRRGFLANDGAGPEAKELLWEVQGLEEELREAREAKAAKKA